MRNLVGTWRCVRVVSKDQNGNALAPPYGGHGIGRIVITDDGRMSVMMVDGRASMPEGQKREYGGYSGSITFDGTKLVTTVDTAPDPARVGTQQPRGVRFEGDLMVLIPPPREINGVTEHRELTWERISPV